MKRNISVLVVKGSFNMFAKKTIGHNLGKM